MTRKDDKKSKDSRSPSLEPQQLELEAQIQEAVHSILRLNGGKWQCCGGLAYVILGVITIILGLIAIIVSGLGAATERYYDTPHNSRLVAMLVLAVIAAATIGVVIYAIIGVRKMHSKPLHTAAIVLIILGIIQALIAGLAVNMSQLDEMHISRSLSESFYRAKDGDPVQHQLWDATQSGLECCGLYNAEDYRDPYGPFHFPPDIPASCCPSSTYPNATREKERQVCKANGTFFKHGCKLLILEVVRGAALCVIVVTALLIAAEVLLAILGAVLSQKRKDEKHDRIEYSPKGTDYPTTPTSK